MFSNLKSRGASSYFRGFKKALEQIDEIIATIKASKEASIAKVSLMDKFGFSETQSQAILEMRLQKD